MEVSLNQPLIIFSLTFGLIAITWQFPGFSMSFLEKQQIVYYTQTMLLKSRSIFMIIFIKAMVLKFSKSRSNLFPLTKDLLMSMNISLDRKFFRPLTPSQCQQLIALLSSQLQGNPRASLELQQPKSSTCSFSCIISFTQPFSNFSISSKLQVLDTRATHHVCCSLSSFIFSILATNLSVALPNGHSIPIQCISSVQLFDNWLILEVLFVHDFQFNLISISALIKTHQFLVNFFIDSYIIQDHTQGEVIGMGKRQGNLYVFYFSSSSKS